MLREVLELNRKAADEGDYEAAYHLLMAALHIVDHAKDLGALEPSPALRKSRAPRSSA